MEYSGEKWSTVEYRGVEWSGGEYSGVQWSTEETGARWWIDHRVTAPCLTQPSNWKDFIVGEKH